MNIPKLIFFQLILVSQFIHAQVNPQNVTIVRDEWGVPHIFAKTDPQVAYGLAYAHAEDDFKTIQFTLLGGKQLLGKYLGKTGAAVDYAVALIRARQTVKENIHTISPDFKALLEGYVQGLNAYARTHPKEVLVKGAFPVTIEDQLTASMLSIASFSGFDRALKSIFDGTVPDLEQFRPKASNAFAFNSNKTVDGQTYLNINSHQPLEGPASWYEAHLCSEDGWNALGGLFPGAATILHGTNERLGWAHTVNYHDKLDVYQLEINPANPNQYRFDGQWIDLEENTVKLKVKLAGVIIGVKKKIYWSKYGPTVVGKTGTFALRFASLFDIKPMEQWYRMNKAKNYTEFYNALKMTSIPGFNIIYADRDDNIFYITNGKIPLRDDAFNWTGTLAGNTSKNLWNTFHPIEDLPQMLNPKSGYIFNTNNTPYSATAPEDNLKPESFDATMGVERWENNRSKRFQELMAGYDKISYDDFKKIKYDLQLPKKLHYFVDASVLFDLKSDDYPALKGIIEKIQRWNKRADADNPEAAIFMLFYNYCNEKFYKRDGIVRKLTADNCIEGLQFANNHLMKHFKTIDIKLGDIQKLVRGKRELPIFGISDVLAAMGSIPYKDGRYKANQGESYIELVRFSKNNLPEIETINCYGASNHPDSPHYSDQMDLFALQKTKKMTLDKATVLKEGKRIYHPQ
ncbi:MAG: penicillin acylase family protein [Arcicella sp.]|nr:penicillin acylase family protein [Arcicella sp.]